MRPPRVLLAKPGLDGHDRGLKVVAMALRDAGVEVIYLGQRKTNEQILQSAVDEDVDVIGVSVLSGAHMALVRSMLDLQSDWGLDIPIVVGGTIPMDDVATMTGWGVRSVYPVGAALEELVAGVVEAATNASGVVS